MSREYRVTWAIDLDADSPEEAAIEAFRIQRNPNSTALVFEVQESGSTEIVEIDLLKNSGDLS